MKKVFFLFALLFTSGCFAEQLHNYEQIKAAVFNGKFLRLFVDYQKCSMTKGMLTIPNHYAVYTPNAMAITIDGGFYSYILFFTMNDPQYPSKPVYQYLRYMISKDNTLQINYSALNAVDYSPLAGTDASMNCKIDDGVTVFVSEQYVNNQTNVQSLMSDG